VVNIVGMSEHIFLHGGQHCRNVIKKVNFQGRSTSPESVVSIIRIGGQDGSEYTLICVFTVYSPLVHFSSPQKVIRHINLHYYLIVN